MPVELDSIEAWRWIWLAAAVVLVVGEIAVAGSFFLAPFAIGAAAAAAVAFAGTSVTVAWLVFVVVSVLASAALRPLARRLDREEWLAESTEPDPITVGDRVFVVRVNGTRLVVRRAVQL